MVSEEASDGKDKEVSVAEGLDCARKERALWTLVRAKVAAGAIAKDDAEAIEKRVREFYQARGIMDDGDTARALHTRHETGWLMATKKAGLELLQTTLLERYPALKDDIATCVGGASRSGR